MKIKRVLFYVISVLVCFLLQDVYKRQVEIKDGGMTLIRVTDNGIGIPKDQIKTAFLRHATSKIRSVEDLLSVSSCLLYTSKNGMQ